MSVYDKNGNLIGDIGGGSSGSYRALRTGTLSTKRPYWILHLDCGRKYFSVTNIKTMIDSMHENGLNQLQLHFSEDKGFRFALNNMTVVTTDGNSFDLSNCVSTDLGGALSESDMDEIIVYARSKNVDIVPSLDMPGHMSKLLTEFPQFRYNSSYSWTLNATDESAVKFALAIVEKYANYFISRGCKYWNIGADEIGYAGTGIGRWKFINSADISKFVEFVNTIADLVTAMGMVPRAFNDGILYNGNYANLFNKNIEIYNWCSATLMDETGIQDVSALVRNGYKLINTNYDWYFIVPSSNSKTSNPRVENANILKAFKNGTTTDDQSGACICIWCDNDSTADGGDAALASILADIVSLGRGIALTLPNLTYPIID